MSTLHGVRCNGCGSQIIFARDRGESIPTKAMLEQVARNAGWNAPDKLGRHWCPDHRLGPQPKRKKP